MSNSASGSLKSETTCKTPLPAPLLAAAMPMAMPVNSSSPAVSVAIGEPSEERWLSVRDVPKPMAPASIARLAIADMALMSASVAGVRGGGCGVVAARGAGLAVDAALAHHVDPQRRVGQLAADVDVELPA